MDRGSWKWVVPFLCGSMLLPGAKAWTDPKPAAEQANSGPAARIERVERGMPPLRRRDDEAPLRLDLVQLMRLFKVPGLSIAVIDDFKIAWAKGYGVKDVGSSEPVTVHTLFQAGSISKPVAAVGALSLVQRGKLALDEDVNRRLKSWQVPDNEFTALRKVTLRHLLSHSSGLPVHGFGGYAVDSPIPTAVQILNGEPPANSLPVRVTMVPGTEFKYSGGGYVLTQLLMIDVTGEPFPAFMRESVLDRMGMADSTYEQPLPPQRASQAATGTRSGGDPVPGRWHVYPEMAAGGLWTTATDLARFAIETASSKRGKANHVLSEAMTREMLTPQIAHRGLGFDVGSYGNLEEFGHGGDDDGFNAVLIMFADSGKGVAIMTNSDNGYRVMEYVVRSVAKEYGWNYTPKPDAELPRPTSML
jgi:CubicO group peptidase (beta-lactamase class C family)